MIPNHNQKVALEQNPSKRKWSPDTTLKEFLRFILGRMSIFFVLVNEFKILQGNPDNKEEIKCQSTKTKN